MNVSRIDIKRYLEGRGKGESADEIKKWLADPVNENEVREILGEIWSNTKITMTGDKPDFERMYSDVIDNFNIESDTKSDRQRSLNMFRLAYQKFSKVAAVLFIPILLAASILFYKVQTNSVDSREVTMREVFTKPGTRTQLELSDGTKVWLNDGTTFRYPENFSGNDRQVYVDGEAYFEVKADVNHTFKVINPMMTTIVTGTHFNLNAYSEDQLFEATLLEGKIHLESKVGKISLDPGEQVQYKTESGSVQKIDVNPQFSTAWVDGKLIIKNQPLELAVKKLSRWYNVDIQIDDSELENLQLSCTLENEKIEQCVQLITQALSINYKYKTSPALGNKVSGVILMK
jgi:ferric-dicitrate binding protein FerR (iron transport regulator)